MDRVKRTSFIYICEYRAPLNSQTLFQDHPVRTRRFRARRIIRVHRLSVLCVVRFSNTSHTDHPVYLFPRRYKASPLSKLIYRPGQLIISPPRSRVPLILKFLHPFSRLPCILISGAARSCARYREQFMNRAHLMHCL